MKIEKADDRGFIESFKVNGREYLLIFTKAGYQRAGHAHEEKQMNILLSGKIEWNGVDYSAVSGIETLSNIYHHMISTTDSLMIEWKE